MNGNMPMSDKGRMMADNAPEMEGENGASDNRITWSPGDYPETEDWEDGQQYTVTMTIRQTSPGEGEIITMTASDEVEEEAPVQNEEAGLTEPTNSNSYPNPAVAKLLARK